MHQLLSFARILFFAAVGEILAALIPLPIPASVYGIALLFLALVSGALPLDAVRAPARFLLEIMPVLFVPAAVGLMRYADLLAREGAAYAFLIVVTTVAVMGVSGRVTQRMLRRQTSRVPVGEVVS